LGEYETDLIHDGSPAIRLNEFRGFEKVHVNRPNGSGQPYSRL
jgi:hypothetical protein